MAFNSLADFNLDVLTKEEETSVINISLDLIEVWKNQPRNFIDPQEITDLANSIKNYEQLSPIIVRSHPEKTDKYLIVAGEKRYWASKEAGCEIIEAKVKDFNDIQAFEIALIENRQRSKLNLIDDTLATLNLIELTTKENQETIVTYLHRIGNKKITDVPIDFIESVEDIFSRTSEISINTFVKKRLRLLKLPNFILDPIKRGDMSDYCVPMIAKLASSDENLAKEIVERVVKENWNRDKIKEEIKKLISNKKPVMKAENFDDIKSDFKKVYSKVLRSSKISSDSKKQRKLQKIIQEMESLL
ncbi:chromosome partitioning protein, ParB family (plasmid) [Chondrocystis sp. NIES-4102]|nr:chromosome partitioning protein, ParB family [Chondrocystis sp. NIES-4102]